MNDIKDIPYAQAKFDKEGKRLSTPTVPAGTTDLIVVSHGWNNNEADAELLYTRLFTNFADLTAGDPAFKSRKVALVGVIWPSQKFDDLMTQIDTSGQATGGAKSTGTANPAVANAAMLEAIDRAAPAFADPGDAERIAQLKALVPKLEKKDAAAQEKFVLTLRELLDPADKNEEQRHKEDGSDIFFEGNPGVIFDNATRHAPATAAPAAPAPTKGKDTASGGSGSGEMVGGAKSLGSFLSGAANAVTNLLNLTTYFEMKQRAGTVGKNGVAPLIDELAGKVERIHLVGHSFGGRVVTAAAANSTTKKLFSMSLLQAAFSHNGFSRKRGGFFRSVVDNKRVSGPILITNTKKDRAVGLAYPAASRISGSTADAFGDANDKFGGIGSNGAQQMETSDALQAAKLLPVKGAYEWQAGRIHNLTDDQFIADPKGGDAHGFVFVPEVAWAISRAVVSG